jgi:GDP-4-dehydro-6-deoxy-D-mannose reductase
MKVLVLGANGFTARHLIERLKQNPENEIYCSSLSVKEEANWLACDLTIESAAHSLIDVVQPDQIYQLAGSFSNDYDTDYRSNVVATRNILEGILKTNKTCRILLVGSSAEYGFVRAEDNPVKEDHPLNPATVYGLTKVYQTHLMRFYYGLHRLNILMARPFNLFGQGISTKLFVGAVYKQIEEYKDGRISKIIVGNLQHSRDYIKIEQAVEYYELIMKSGRAGEIYNVGSGTAVVMHDLLKSIMEESGLGMDVVEERRVDNVLKLDIKNLIASLDKIHSLPELDFE